MLRAFEQAYSTSSTAKFLAKETVAMTYAVTSAYSNKTNGTHTASSWLVVTRCSTPLCATLSRILDTATSDKSLAMISLTPGTSLAYRMLRRPDADKASNIVRPSWNKMVHCSGKDSSFRIWAVWDRASVHRQAVITTLPVACHESIYASGQILGYTTMFMQSAAATEWVWGPTSQPNHQTQKGGTLDCIYTYARNASSDSWMFILWQ